jgi:serine/threonine-protein kinase
MAANADRNLLFGLVALQNGLIDQTKLVAAFHAWTLDKLRSIADLLVAQGAFDESRRAAVDALVAIHLEAHGGDVEKSLAALPVGPSTHEQLTRIPDPDLHASLAPVTVAPDAAARAGLTLSLPTSPDQSGVRFRTLRFHDRGGLGEVFVAEDTELRREVALKQIQDRHAQDSASRQRFLDEAEITGGLEHPGIVPVYGLGTYGDGRPFYAMRFIRGGNLRDAIARFHASKADPGTRSLELRKLLRRFTDVCNAIEYAHTRGVLHRDIKPGNVIVGKFGETLVVDWGLAKALGADGTAPKPGLTTGPLVPPSGGSHEPTQAGSALGTPGFMSPEQARGDLRRLGPATDIYSLGATLYCALTGRPPFSGGDAIARAIRGDVPAPRSVNRAVPPALEAVCLKALSLRPEDRYPSAAALRDDVGRWLDGEPVSVGREPLWTRSWRWVRKHRTLATTAAAVALVGMVFLFAAYRREARYSSDLAAANTEIRRRNVALASANVRLDRANAATTQEKNKTEAALAETTKAKTETEAALARSEESRKQAEAVSTFLVEAFRSPDPPRKGRDVRVADVLDLAVEKLGTAFTGTVATRGALLHVMGQTYYGLGLYDKAGATLENARAVREAMLGPDHRDTLASRSDLAMAYLAAGWTSGDHNHPTRNVR